MSKHSESSANDQGKIRTFSWKTVSNFFEQGDLVPFAVVISIYHYAVALMRFDEYWLVAIAQGLLVDMLHFRTVRQAVKVKTWPSMLVAALTTGLSFGVHLIFYAYHEGTWTITATAVFLALTLPLAIPVLAWLHEATKDSKAVAAVKSLLVAAEERIKGLELRVNDGEARLNDYEAKNKELEGRVKIAEDQNRITEGLLMKSEERRKETEAQLKEMQATLKLLGPFGKAMVLELIPGKTTGKAVATKFDLAEGTVSNIKSKLNGGGQK